MDDFIGLLKHLEKNHFFIPLQNHIKDKSEVLSKFIWRGVGLGCTSLEIKPIKSNLFEVTFDKLQVKRFYVFTKKPKKVNEAHKDKLSSYYANDKLYYILDG